ncbi:MAG: hypothetical protein P1U36_07625 [Legionellaceae bacterium]|nr:hypothetical protein [Legionellaceae bacterium]
MHTLIETERLILRPPELDDEVPPEQTHSSLTGIPEALASLGA